MSEHQEYALVVGVFSNQKEAKQAVDEVKMLGIGDEQIIIESLNCEYDEVQDEVDDNKLLSSTVGEFFNRIFGMPINPNYFTKASYSPEFKDKVRNCEIIVGVKSMDYWREISTVFDRYDALEEVDFSEVFEEMHETPAERLEDLKKQYRRPLSYKKNHQRNEDMTSSPS